MKTGLNIFKKLVVFLLFALFVTNAGAQDQTVIKQIIESKKFVFKVQTINPTSGNVRQSTGEYDLKILGDSLVSYLPYFGRAYAAPLPGERGGYNFTSSRFDYSVVKRKKGGWEISIKPKDVNDVRQFSLVLSEKGNGTLNAVSNSRQPISYYGYIAPVKQQ